MKSSIFLTRRNDVEDLELLDGEVRLLSIQDSSPSSGDEIGGAYVTISQQAAERERRTQQIRQAQRQQQPGANTSRRHPDPWLS